MHLPFFFFLRERLEKTLADGALKTHSTLTARTRVCPRVPRLQTPALRAAGARDSCNCKRVSLQVCTNCRFLQSEFTKRTFNFMEAQEAREMPSSQSQLCCNYPIVLSCGAAVVLFLRG